MAHVEETFHWQTPNTKLAANFGALGFPLKTRVFDDERSRRSETHFYVAEKSLWYPSLDRHDLLEQWKKKELEKADPLHPFLQGLRVEHNYELLLDAQKRGRRLKLAGVTGSFATEYRDGEEEASMIFAPEVIVLADLSLCAALGTLGIPVIKIEGVGRDHRYTLPRYGHVLRKNAAGEANRYDAAAISRRVAGKIDLELEHTDKTHPLVAAYNVRHVHIQLLRHLREEARLLWLRPPGTGRTALVSEHATDDVLDRVQKHFRIA